MSVSLKYLVAALIVGHASVSLASDPSQWPTAPSRLVLETPYGDLQVSPSDYIYESRLMLDDHEIDPLIQGLLNIPYAFSSPDFHVALVSIDTGTPVCPISYAWIMLKNDGYSVTPRFGSCSEHIKVSAEGSVFSLLTPNETDPDQIDSYLYDGQTVTLKTTTSEKTNNDVQKQGR